MFRIKTGVQSYIEHFSARKLYYTIFQQCDLVFSIFLTNQDAQNFLSIICHNFSIRSIRSDQTILFETTKTFQLKTEETKSKFFNFL